MTNKIIDNTFFGALLLSFLDVILLSCSPDELNDPSPEDNTVFISAVDLSSNPQISNSNPSF